MPEQAHKWLSAAAEQGHKGARTELGESKTESGNDEKAENGESGGGGWGAAGAAGAVAGGILFGPLGAAVGGVLGSWLGKKK